jgi:type IV pilus assembly protein PilB
VIIDTNIAKVLIDDNVLTGEQLQKVLNEHYKTKENLTRIIERLGFSTEEEIIKVISNHYEIPYEEINEDYVNREVIELIKPDLARKFKTIPLNLIANQLTVAMSDPLNLIALDTLSFTSGKKIKPIICPEDTIDKLIDTFFGPAKEVEQESRTESFYYSVYEEESEAVEVDANAAPVIRVVNILLIQAVKSRASDIHIEGGKSEVMVRFRVDGLLRKIKALPKKIQPALIARIKVMAGLDIAERIKPQDGRFFIRMNTGREVDFRVSTYSTVFGESSVLRIMDQSKSQVTAERLGMTELELSHTRDAFGESSGLILICGPTGSGKTTTMYAVLNEINTIDRKIITIEDPVEYRIPLANQISINVKRGLTYPTILRSALRQDPDVLLIGEIRDGETAQIAARAAATGHLVISTLHVTSPAKAFGRLNDLGVEDFYIADTISLIIGQRIIRRLCEKCREAYHPSIDELLKLGIREQNDGIVFARPVGCPACDNTGYHGMTGIYEVLRVNSDISDFIRERRSAQEIRSEAKRLGMTTMWENAIEKIQQGAIYFEDVLRSIPRDY